MDTTTPDSQALPSGTHLHEFVIERVLGSGGFGITYLARDTSLGRQVVIKENLPTQFVWRETATGTVRPRHSTGGDTDDFEWSMKNFLREAETLATMDHSGIVRVLRKFEVNGTAYFVMPFVQGIAFDQLIEQRLSENKPFTEEELRGLLARMLDALGYLHDRGIYHRDIKPANLLITMEGIPTLIDFGSARQRLSERSMTVIESAGYTPFEQLQSRGKVGPWSDLYALGATLAKAITGEAPPKATDRAFDDPFIPLADRDELVDTYSPVLLYTIDRALAVNVKDRWQNAGEWLEALRELTAPSTAAVRLSPASVPRHEPALTPVLNVSPSVEASAKKSNRLTWMISAVIVLGLFVLIRVIFVNNDERVSITITKDSLQREAKARAEEEQALGKAMTTLGIHKLPNELSKDELAAINHYRKASEAGDAGGMAYLGVCYANGTGVAKNEAEAVKWYRKAAEAGDADGMTNLGYSYDTGKGVTKDAAEAVKWYRKAAEAGNAGGMTNLGVCYDNGTGVAKDEAEAVKWYRKAAEAGNAGGMTRLGVCYAKGEGVTKNEAEAVKWYRKAAEAGDAPGMACLGLCYENGTGVTKDEAEAVKWYRKAAEAGDAGGMTNLGVCYDNGTGVAKDEAEAVKWYRKAAEAGDARGMTCLGVCYESGEGVTKDAAEAVKWYRKAAEAGNAGGMTNLGLCYAKGEGATKDAAEAVNWFRKAAEAGDAGGMDGLGVCYEHGIGVAKNVAEAVKWYRKAADKGEPNAQYNLGLCYANGKGVAKDPAEAVKWYRKAAEQGNVEAKKILEPAQPAINALIADKTTKARFKTSEGEFVIELNAAKAPITVSNFLGYVKKKHYDGTVFHRVINGFMIQGGGFAEYEGKLVEKSTGKGITNEGQNGLKNDRGTIAMARTNDPNSATAQFFINVVNNDTLNFPNNGGYAVFGKVIEGMDVVDKIKAVATADAKITMRHPSTGEKLEMPSQNVPTKNVVIISATVVQ